MVGRPVSSKALRYEKTSRFRSVIIEIVNLYDIKDISKVFRYLIICEIVKIFKGLYCQGLRADGRPQRHHLAVVRKQRRWRFPLVARMCLAR